MDYKEFEEELIKIIKEKVGISAKISIHSVNKNNGIKLTGIVIMDEGECISPTVYLEPFYETAVNGKELGDIADEVLRICREQKGQFDFNIDDFQNLDITKKKIFYKLINYDGNKEILENMPYRRFLDFAVVYYVLVSCDELGYGTVLIKNEHLKLWNVTEEDLFAYSEKNTPLTLGKVIKPMDEIIHDLLGSDDILEPDVKKLDFSGNAPVKMYVMGNEIKLNGACTVLYENALSDFAKTVGGDFYILPSSIHEVILVPKTDGVDEEALLSLVREVNKSSVSREEWLSDNIYRYIYREGITEIIK